MDIDTVVNSEPERLQWVAADSNVDSQVCNECYPEGGCEGSTARARAPELLSPASPLRRLTYVASAQP
jgi:hypothetical protein